ncbi:hypothetical protein BDV96DRAFT_599684 [Lophiotrema nucula]|uniref:Uncharacterized protein n=1 Tax=Lophiotrema nucula TaxID=690887 RepID=A0A6A5Z762_9PLEO|nr:hypothetical protein BDV96DRAFT_599684 [Lophiotrema nucula]
MKVQLLPEGRPCYAGQVCDGRRVLAGVWELRTRLCELQPGYTGDQGASHPREVVQKGRARLNSASALGRCVARSCRQGKSRGESGAQLEAQATQRKGDQGAALSPRRCRGACRTLPNARAQYSECKQQSRRARPTRWRLGLATAVPLRTAGGSDSFGLFTHCGCPWTGSRRRGAGSKRKRKGKETRGRAGQLRQGIRRAWAPMVAIRGTAKPLLQERRRACACACACHRRPRTQLPNCAPACIAHAGSRSARRRNPSRCSQSAREPSDSELERSTPDASNASLARPRLRRSDRFTGQRPSSPCVFPARTLVRTTFFSHPAAMRMRGSSGGLARGRGHAQRLTFPSFRNSTLALSPPHSCVSATALRRREE